MPSRGANSGGYCQKCSSAERQPRYAGPEIQSAGDLDQAIRRRLDRADGRALDELRSAVLPHRCPTCGAHLDSEQSDTTKGAAKPSPKPDGWAHRVGLDILDQDFLATADQQSVLAALLDAAVEQTSASTANAQLFDHERRGLYIAAHMGLRRAFLDFFDWVGLDGSACATAAATGRSVTVSNVLLSPLFDDESKQVMLDARLYAVQSIPLLSTAGLLLGVFSCHYHNAGNPSDDVEPMLQAMAEATAWSLTRPRQGSDGEVV